MQNSFDHVFDWLSQTSFPRDYRYNYFTHNPVTLISWPLLITYSTSRFLFFAPNDPLIWTNNRVPGYKITFFCFPIFLCWFAFAHFVSRFFLYYNFSLLIVNLFKKEMKSYQDWICYVTLIINKHEIIIIGCVCGIVNHYWTGKFGASIKLKYKVLHFYWLIYFVEKASRL